MRPGPVQQACLDDAFVGQPPHGAAQSLDGPVGPSALVQDPNHIAPRLGRAHPPHRRQPIVQLGQNTLEMGGVSASANLSDGIRIAGTQTRIAADATAATGGEQAGFGAFGDQRPLKLGDRAQHL